MAYMKLNGNGSSNISPLLMLQYGMVVDLHQAFASGP